jgi:hypothetical protein
MSTPTHARVADPVSTAVVPQPRPPAEPPIPAVAEPQPAERAPDAGEPAGLFVRHGWLIPATAIASVIAVFVAMVLITWVAGGVTPFDR